MVFTTKPLIGVFLVYSQTQYSFFAVCFLAPYIRTWHLWNGCHAGIFQFHSNSKKLTLITSTTSNRVSDHVVFRLCTQMVQISRSFYSFLILPFFPSRRPGQIFRLCSNKQTKPYVTRPLSVIVPPHPCTIALVEKHTMMQLLIV